MINKLRKYTAAQSPEGLKMLNKLKRYNESIGKKIANIRRLKGLSNETIGAMIGVTLQQSVKYQNGSNRISAATLALLAEKLQVDIKYFFDDLKYEILPVSKYSKRELIESIDRMQSDKLRYALYNLIKTLE